MTAKARIASMRCPATGSPAGVGSSMMATRAATARISPQLLATQLPFSGGARLLAAVPWAAGMAFLHS